MKKLFQFLLIKYPLLWNTRFPVMLAVTGISNLLYFFIGWSFTSHFPEVRYEIESSYFESGLFLSALILQILIFILWLYFYFRNNAYKAFYPIKKSYLLAEFFLVLFLSTLNIFLFISWKSGVIAGTKSKYSTEKITAYKAIINKAAPFRLQYKSQYEQHQYCGTPMSMKYSAVEAEPIYPGNLISDAYCCKDSILSYYQFCDFPFYENDTEKRELVKANQELLRERNPTKIKEILEDYNAVLAEFDKAELTGIERIAENVFMREDFEIHPSAFRENEADYYGYYDLNNIDNIVSVIDDNMEPDLDYWIVALVHLFIGLGFALAIISFRITSVKEWLIALVAAGVLATILGLFNLLFGLTDETFGLSYLFCMGIFILLALFGRLINLKKSIQGVCINLALWCAPYVFLLSWVTADLKMNTANELYTGLISLILGIIISLGILFQSFIYKSAPEE